MYNIIFKGNYKDESQLENNPHQESGTIFNEPDSLRKVFMMGFLVYLPFFALLMGLTILKIVNSEYSINPGIISGSMISASILSLICIFFHELIHAANYPLDAIKEIWLKPKDLAAFVYCNSMVSKSRFIWLSLAPNIILGLLPLMLWFTGVLDFNTRISLITMIMAHVNIFSGTGDYLNVWLALRQVPAGADIFNSGFHSYWIQKQS